MSKPVFILSALVFLAPSMASGQESAVHPIIADKFMLNAGIFFPEKEFEVQVNGPQRGRGHHQIAKPARQEESDFHGVREDMIQQE